MGSALGGVLKGLIYQADIHDFLHDPKKRLAYIRLVHQGYESWTTSSCRLPTIRWPAD